MPKLTKEGFIKRTYTFTFHDEFTSITDGTRLGFNKNNEQILEDKYGKFHMEYSLDQK